MKQITIIRHAESLFNAKKNIDPKGDLKNCGLTENGKLQAQKLNFTFDYLILSPLERAIETFKNSNIITNDVIYSKLFREVSYDFFSEEELFKMETEEEIKLRAKEAKKFIEEQNCLNIGIISHGRFSYYLLEEFGKEPKYLKNTEHITFFI